MGRRNLLMLLALAAIWGSSFMFIEIALRDLAPSTLICCGWLRRGRAGRLHRRHGPQALSPATVALAARAARLANTALPFFLIAWGQQYIDLASPRSSTPRRRSSRYVFALAYDRSQRATGLRLVGILVGFTGVVLLVGFELGRRARGRRRARCRRRLRLLRNRRALRGPPLRRSARLAGGVRRACLVDGLRTCSAFAQASSFGWEAMLSVLYLGVAATGVGYLLYFGLIARAGASRAVLVTYLARRRSRSSTAPSSSTQVHALAPVGLVLVLAGVALGTGTGAMSRYWPMPRRWPPSGARRTSSSRSPSTRSSRRR